MNFDTSLALFQHLLAIDEDNMASNLPSLIDEKHEFYTEVKTLIAAHEENKKQTSFKALIGKQAEQLVEDNTIHELIGTQVGVYKLVKKLGQGGMGAVYLGERNDGELEQRVAIKFVYPSIVELAGQDFLQREAQHLANLNHVNIAKIYNVGKTKQNIPYMVMEYVDGVPIDEYCDKNELRLKERLKLYKKVCNAVQNAHQNMIIHADIKPSNILVDKQGEPKLMDFGISKTINSNREAEAGSKLNAGSLDYASPEQRSGVTLTTATDIYALGKVFHKLFLSQSISSIEFNSLVRATTPNDSTTSFGSVSILEQNVEALISNTPLTCIKESPLYRFKKLSLRNPITTISVVILAMTISTSALLLWLQNQRLLIEKEVSEQSIAFLENVFEFSSPYKNQKSNTTVKDLLANAKTKLQGNTKIPEESANRIKLSLALAHTTTGSQKEGKELLDSIISKEIFVLLRKHFLDAQLAYEITDFDVALSHIKEGLALAGASDYKEEYFNLLSLKANVYRKLRDFEMGQSAVAAMKDYAVQTEQVEFLIRTYIQSSALYYDKPDYEQSILYTEQALQAYNNNDLTDKPLLSNILYNYGSALEELDKLDEAEKIYQKVVRINEDIFGLDHPIAATNYNLLSYFYHTAGKYDKARDFANKAIDIHKEHSPYSAYEYVDSLFNLAFALKELSQPRGAINALLEAENVYLQFLPEQHHKLTNLYSGLGVLYKHIGEFDLGMKFLHQALEISLSSENASQTTTAAIYGNLGNVAIEQQDYQQAEQYYLKRHAIHINVYGEESSKTAQSLKGLARLYRYQKKYEQALLALNSATSIALKAFPKEHPTLSGYFAQKAIILKELGDITPAIEQISKAIAIAETAYGNNNFTTHGYKRILADLLILKGQPNKALELAQAAYAYQKALVGVTHPEVKRIEETIMKAQEKIR